MKPSRIVSFALLTTLSLALSALAGELPFATITGQVTDTDGNAIPYPSVIAVAGDDTLGAYMSDGSGRYRIDLSFPVPTGVEEDVPESIPVELLQNYPNPFNPSTTVAFDMAGTGDARLVVYSLTGQKIATLFDGQASPGMHRVVWNGCDDYGRHAGSGVYIYRLKAGGAVQVRKMLLLDSGMVSTGGAAVTSHYDERSSTAAKPASITCDIIASKPGYESVTIPGITVPVGTENIAQDIAMTREDIISLRIPLEVGASWEFVELETNSGSYGSRLIQNITHYTFEIIGSRVVNGLNYYEFDTWPVFVPVEFHDPEQLPLMRSNESTGALYFIYNGEEIPLFPPGEESLDVVLSDGPIEGYNLRVNHAGGFTEGYNLLFTIDTSSSYMAAPYFYHGNDDSYYTYHFNSQKGLVSFNTGRYGQHQFRLKQFTSPSGKFDVIPIITPKDGIQTDDVAYLIKIAFFNSISSVLTLYRPVWLATIGIDDPALVPEFPFLRFHLTSAMDVDTLVDENHAIIGLNMLKYSQRPDSTIAVEFAYYTHAYTGAPPLSGGGHGERFIFYSYEDTWGWEVFPWFAD